MLEDVRAQMDALQAAAEISSGYRGLPIRVEESREHPGQYLQRKAFSCHKTGWNLLEIFS
jgi:hypothetical protein